MQQIYWFVTVNCLRLNSWHRHTHTHTTTTLSLGFGHYKFTVAQSSATRYHPSSTLPLPLHSFPSSGNVPPSGHFTKEVTVQIHPTSGPSPFFLSQAKSWKNLSISSCPHMQCSITKPVYNTLVLWGSNCWKFMSSIHLFYVQVVKMAIVSRLPAVVHVCSSCWWGPLPINRKMQGWQSCMPIWWWSTSLYPCDVTT